MVNIVVEKEIDVPAKKVWQLLAKFGDISWVPGLDKVEVEGQGIGMLRKITVGDAPPAVERLDTQDHAAMSFSYSIVSGNSMPIENLQGGGRVSALDDNRCLLQWTASGAETGIDEQQAQEMLRGMYSGLLELIAGAVGRTGAEA